MPPAVVLTSLNKLIVKLQDYKCYILSSYIYHLPGPGASTACASSSGFSGSFFLAWALKGSFL